MKREWSAFELGRREGLQRDGKRLRGRKGKKERREGREEGEEEGEGQLLSSKRRGKDAIFSSPIVQAGSTANLVQGSPLGSDGFATTRTSEGRGDELESWFVRSTFPPSLPCSSASLQLRPPASTLIESVYVNDSGLTLKYKQPLL